MSYQRVIDKIQANDLAWDDIDRILLNSDTFAEFEERASFDVSDHYTNNKPAVRISSGQEKIVYVSKNGIEVTIEL